MRLTVCFALGVACLLVLVPRSDGGSNSTTVPSSGKTEKSSTSYNKPHTVTILVWETKPIPFVKEYIRDTNMPRGALKKIRDGKEGRMVLLYRTTLGPKGVIKKELLHRSVDPPQSELYLIGVEGYKTSRGSFSGRNVLIMTATAYDPGPASCGKYASGYTATGIKAEYGVVAVDPKVIPLGTRLYVEGYGYAIAADVGSKVKGMNIDLCFPTYRQAKAFGRKKVKVHILD